MFYLLAKLHFVFGSLFVVGIILFIVWALKNVTKAKLKKLSLWLIVIGIIGSFASGSRWKHGKGSDAYNTMMIEAFSNQGITVSEEQMEAVYEELKESKKSKWRK